MTQKKFFIKSFEVFKSKCKWMLYFDVDEYLEFVNKNITINNYLSQDRFNKCNVIKVNWVLFNNEDLLYYDNRTLQERFTKPTAVETVKSIIINDSRINPWIKAWPHEPGKGLFNFKQLFLNLIS